MDSFLSKERVDYLSQSPSTRKIMDFEAKQEALDIQAEKLERAEVDFEKSQKVGKGRLRDEWKEVGSGRRVRHEKTGRLLLGDSPIVDGEHLLLRADGGESVEVVTRYSYSGQLRDITGCFGDAETGEVFTLAQGMKARRVEVEEVESPDWHLKYSSGKWHVVKSGGLFAGAFADLQQAQGLVDLLRAADEIKPLNQDISFRQV